MWGQTGAKIFHIDNFQADDACDGDCNDMDEDITNEEEDESETFRTADEEENPNSGDSNIIVIDEDAQSDSKDSEKPEATDMIYIDDTADAGPRHVPDIDIGRIKFSP